MKCQQCRNIVNSVRSGIIACAIIVAVQTVPAQIGHRILISGADLGYVAIVNANGVFEWKYTQGGQTNDSWLLPNGNIIFSYSSGVKMVTPDFINPQLSKVVWDRKVRTGGEIHSCQPLDGGSGRFLIGESFDTISYIVEVDTLNVERLRIALPRFGSGSHNQFRQIRKTPQNTYLVTQQASGGKAFEYDNTGRVVRTFPNGRYCAQRLANGNTLIDCGDEGAAIECDSGKTPAIVWQVNRNDITGSSLGFVAGMERLANGNTLITNWTGHGVGTGPAIVEITRARQVVSYSGANIANRVSSVKVIDGATGIGMRGFGIPGVENGEGLFKQFIPGRAGERWVDLGGRVVRKGDRFVSGTGYGGRLDGSIRNGQYLCIKRDE